MKIREIIKATAGVAGAINPALGAAINFFNAFAPEGRKIPHTSDSVHLSEAIGNLPDKLRDKILNHDLEVNLAEISSWENIQKSHSEADKSGSSTRPFIALMMAWTIIFSVVPLSLALAYSAIAGNVNVIGMVENATLPLLTLIGTPTVLLRAYFGLRTEEKKARYSASVGQEINPGLINYFLGALKGKKEN